MDIFRNSINAIAFGHVNLNCTLEPNQQFFNALFNSNQIKSQHHFLFLYSFKHFNNLLCKKEIKEHKKSENQTI